MSKKSHNIAVIGDGGWGSTLAVLLARKDYPVTLWGPFSQYLDVIRKTRYNPKFLPNLKIPEDIIVEADLKTALSGKDVLIFAVPSQYSADVIKKIKATKTDLSKSMILSVTKGFDNRTLLRVSEVIEKHLPGVPLAVLSGPTIAIEVAKGIPSTAVIASRKAAVAKQLQDVVNSQTFRIYTNNDVAGVELGGSLKNIIAIACGVCDGLGFGTNTKAALVTRGLAEMARFGKAMGAKAKTFQGLSGLGDLVTTCFSPNSRNRSVGEQLGKGKNIKQIIGAMNMVAEGVETVKPVYKLSYKLRIPMPITSEVYQIIYRNKSPQKAVADLMSRKTKAE